MTTTGTTGDVLDDALALLRSLPRAREAVRDARRAVEAWRLTYPDLDAGVVIDAPPGAPVVDYDLLLTFADAGTLALAWREDRKTPWLESYADHWAANYVVTVGERRLTAQQALVWLRACADGRADLMAAMVDHLLFQELADADTDEVSFAERDAAAIELRRELGLHSVVATRAWLAELQLSDESLGAMLDNAARIARAKDRLVARELEAWFARHRAGLDRAHVLEVSLASRPAAIRTAAEARLRGLPSVVGGLELGDTAALATRHLRELPAEVRCARPAEVIGPLTAGDRHAIYQVLDRLPAQLDEPTRAIARREICAAWAAERRKRTPVRWHWM